MEFLKFGEVSSLDELLKEAEKKNITEKLETEDIKIGDKIISRFTAKEGTVTGILCDGRTIEVEIDGGNKMNISKESVYKIKGKENIIVGNDTSNAYGDVKPLIKNNKDIEDIKQEVPEFKVSKLDDFKIEKQEPNKDIKTV
jgi:hypothetical protein